MWNKFSKNPNKSGQYIVEVKDEENYFVIAEYKATTKQWEVCDCYGDKIPIIDCVKWHKIPKYNHQAFCEVLFLYPFGGEKWQKAVLILK